MAQGILPANTPILVLTLNNDEQLFLNPHQVVAMHKPMNGNAGTLVVATQGHNHTVKEDVGRAVEMWNYALQANWPANR